MLTYIAGEKNVVRLGLPRPIMFLLFGLSWDIHRVVQKSIKPMDPDKINPIQANCLIVYIQTS